MERAELEKVLGEQELGFSGTVRADTAAKVGHLTGAKVLVTGRVFKADKEPDCRQDHRHRDQPRLWRDGERHHGCSITDLAGELAKKIAATVSQKGDTLVAKVESREDRIAKIKKALKSDKLPRSRSRSASATSASPSLTPPPKRNWA